MTNIGERLEKANVSACNDIVLGDFCPNSGQNSPTTGYTPLPDPVHLDLNPDGASQLSQGVANQSPCALVQSMAMANDNHDNKATRTPPSPDPVPIDHQPTMISQGITNQSPCALVQSMAMANDNHDNKATRATPSPDPVTIDHQPTMISQGITNQSPCALVQSMAMANDNHDSKATRTTPSPDPVPIDHQPTMISQGIAKPLLAKFPPIGKTGENWTTPQKTLITLDWLELKLDSGFLSLEAFSSKGICRFGKGTEVYNLELLPFGGKTYRTGAVVYYGNTKLGTIHFDSIFENLAKTAKFQIENAAFYDDWANLTLHYLIQNFVKCIGSKVLGVLRADIALDGHQFADFAHNVGECHITPLRQKSLHSAHFSLKDAKREITGFSYGSRQSGRLIRCYNKSREIAEKSKHKSYILDYWKVNQVNQSAGNIWRLEYELRTDFLKTVDGFSWDQLFDKKRLLGLSQVATNGFFEWVHADVIRNAKNASQRQKRLQRAERIRVVDFSQVQTNNYQRIRAKQKPKTDRTAKIMIKQLALSAALCTESEPEKALNYAKVAGLLMEGNDLQSYVAMKNYFWQPQFEREAWRKGRGVNSMLDIANLATSLTDLQNVYV
ncbi:hypothetical protein [Haliscomenobacter sp.]|uniref:hypothetical protein n=1 Tax=Haliscomenobacter sp. TaxID=2717303 RepID=UPI003BAC5DD1